MSTDFFRFLLDDLARAPGDDVQVDDRVQDEQQVHGRDHEQVEHAGHDAPELLRMDAGRYEEGAGQGDQEDGRRRADTVLAQLQRRTDDDGHHDQRVAGRQDLRQDQLPCGRSQEADDDEDQDRVDVVEETLPVADVECSHEGTHQHEENRSRTENSTAHQHSL